LSPSRWRAVRTDGVLQLDRLDLHDRRPDQEGTGLAHRELVLCAPAGHHQRAAAGDGLVERVDRGRVQAGGISSSPSSTGMIRPSSTSRSAAARP